MLDTNVNDKGDAETPIWDDGRDMISWIEANLIPTSNNILLHKVQDPLSLAG